MMQTAAAIQLNWDISQGSKVGGVLSGISPALRLPLTKASAAGLICSVSTDVISDEMVGIVEISSLSLLCIPYP